MAEWIRCDICEKRTKTYYDKEMAAVEGAGGYVTDCGTGGCPFTTGTTWHEARSKYASHNTLSNLSRESGEGYDHSQHP